MPPRATWTARRNPVNLAILPAESHPAGLRRITYTRADGLHAEGVTAFAHLTGHLHLGWAMLGWLLLLPGVNHIARLCLTAFGPPPRFPKSHPSPR